MLYFYVPSIVITSLSTLTVWCQRFKGRPEYFVLLIGNGEFAVRFLRGNLEERGFSITVKLSCT